MSPLMSGYTEAVDEWGEVVLTRKPVSHYSSDEPVTLYMSAHPVCDENKSDNVFLSHNFTSLTPYRWFVLLWWICNVRRFASVSMKPSRFIHHRAAVKYNENKISKRNQQVQCEQTSKKNCSQ